MNSCSLSVLSPFPPFFPTICRAARVAGLIDTVAGKEPIYVFNAFFMVMRSKFTKPGESIHYYSVEFEPATLKWADFRGKVLGPTDPAAAPVESIRGQIVRARAAARRASRAGVECLLPARIRIG
jgi:hypothetical protein